MTRFARYRVGGVLLACMLVWSSCQPLQKKERVFRFDPPFRKEYRYSLTIRSSSLIRRYVNDILTDTANKNITDSVELEFTLKNIYDMDSNLICKLTFHDFKKKAPRINAAITGPLPGPAVRLSKSFCPA